MCCFGNLTAVRERILAWWSSVSTIDANNHPEINTRVLLVCGNDGPSAAAEGEEEEEEEEEEGVVEMSGAELLSGVLLYQLMQCADVEITDERPDGPTRHALREVMTATRDDGPGGGWPKARPPHFFRRVYLCANRPGSCCCQLRDGLERQLIRQELASDDIEVAELLVVDQYQAVPTYSVRDGSFREDPLAGMSLDLRFDESIRHKL